MLSPPLGKHLKKPSANLESARDLVQDVGDVSTEKRQRTDSDNRDQRDDQRVLNQALAFFFEAGVQISRQILNHMWLLSVRLISCPAHNHCEK